MYSPQNASLSECRCIKIDDMLVALVRTSCEPLYSGSGSRLEMSVRERLGKYPALVVSSWRVVILGPFSTHVVFRIFAPPDSDLRTNKVWPTGTVQYGVCESSSFMLIRDD